MIIAILFTSVLLSVFMILPSALIIYTVNAILGIVSTVHLDFWPTTIAFAYLISLALAIQANRKAKTDPKRTYPPKAEVIDHE